LCEINKDRLRFDIPGGDWDNKLAIPTLDYVEKTLKSRIKSKAGECRQILNLYTEFSAERRKRLNSYLATGDWIQSESGRLKSALSDEYLSLSFDETLGRAIVDETLKVIDQISDT
jgi:hypothetical protein